MKFRARCEKLNLDIPFIFHAGETLGDGSEADMNLYDAILLGTKRIGHGLGSLSLVSFASNADYLNQHTGSRCRNIRSS